MPYIWERVRRQKNAYLLSLEVETPAKRLQAWRDLMRDRAMEMTRDTSADSIQGSILGQAYDGGAISRWNLTPQTVYRNKRLASSLDGEFNFVSIITKGSSIYERNGVKYHLRPGDFIIVDGTRPFSATAASEHNSRGFIILPKLAMQRRLGSRHELTMDVFRQETPLQRLVAAYLTNLTNVVGELDRVTLTTLIEQSLDMIAMVASERRPSRIEPSTHQAAMLLRLKLDIKANLKNPNYTVTTAAAALGVSSRYINSLLAAEATSFGRYIIKERLEGARRQIIDPRFLNKQITEIAFDWGFNNASHFGRVFKDRFGMTPREAKMTSIYDNIGAAA